MGKKFDLNKIREKYPFIYKICFSDDLLEESLGEVWLNDGYEFEWGGHYTTFKSKNDLIESLKLVVKKEGLY